VLVCVAVGCCTLVCAGVYWCVQCVPICTCIYWIAQIRAGVCWSVLVCAIELLHVLGAGMCWYVLCADVCSYVMMSAMLV